MQNNETEKCIVCGKDTGILSSEPIKKRNNYVSGAGQLCENCYCELYLLHDPYDPNTLNELQIKELLDMCINQRRSNDEDT